MFNRLSVLWLVLGAIGGYAAAGPSATAQDNASFFTTAINPGSTAALTFERGTMSEGSVTLNCTVAELQGRWVRCKATDAFQEDREQQWYSLAHVTHIKKQNQR